MLRRDQTIAGREDAIERDSFAADMLERVIFV